MRRHTVYLLSPANCAGKRAGTLLVGGGPERLHFGLANDSGAPLGEVFAFMSGLYFRGKMAYARRFAEAPDGVSGAHIIAPGHGLVPADTPITLGDLRAMACVPVDEADPRFRDPLLSKSRALDEVLDSEDRVVLLGSVATAKYLDPLLETFGTRLYYPEEFVGRGDMSRGGLMLRCAEAGHRLQYVTAATAPRHGPRPPRLERIDGSRGG